MSLPDRNCTTTNSGGVPVVVVRRRSWDKPHDWCPRCAGRRAVDKHGEALRRLAEND